MPNKPTTIPIKGDRLRADREDQNLTQTNILHKIKEINGVQLSEMTIRRAENNCKASRVNLAHLARALGFQPSRYLQEEEYPESIIDISGKWTVFYQTKDVIREAYYDIESLIIDQSGNKINGTYIPIGSTHPEGYIGTDEFTMTGRIKGPTIFGQYERRNLLDLRGTGVFQLKMVRENDWAEGACTFFSWDETIEVSVNIWIRDRAANYNLLVRRAKEILSSGDNLLFELPISVGI